MEKLDSEPPWQTKASNYLRVAVIGNVDSGKSTIVSVLSKGILDDGRGSARTRISNYAHESENGKTTSITHEIVGFDSKGNQVLPDPNIASKNKTWQDVGLNSSKIVSMIDLCGHEKYLKTTMLGMVSLVPDYAMIVISANLGISRMTKEHLGIALALRIPFFVVITKVDMVPEEVTKSTITQLSKLLNASVVNKRALVVDYDQTLTAFKNSIETNDNISETIKEKSIKTYLKSESSTTQTETIAKVSTMVKSDRVCPIFLASSTHGYGIPQIVNFLGKVESRSTDSNTFGTPTQPVEYDIHETFMVHGAGFVVSGLVKAGTIKTGQTLTLGPDELNSTKQVMVKSIFFNRIPVSEGRPGQFCTLALKAIKKKDELTRKDFRKGAVLLDGHAPPKFSIGFEASVSVLHHATTIKSGYECMFHSGVVRQAIKIVSMDKELLRTGETSQVKFKFLYRPEFIKQDAPFLMREGRTKILGVITKLIYSKEEMQTSGSSKIFN